MLASHGGKWVIALVMVTSSLAGSTAATRSRPGPYEEAVKRAIELLPKRPHKVLVVDAERAVPPIDAHGRRVEAFATRGDSTVYLIAQGDILQHALGGPSVFDYALAAIIWHEMAHLAGADERVAQQKEEALWKEYLLQHRVDTVRGLNYLALLQKRR
jgi:hypothetical protein